jgi:hypothetical protein
MSKTYRAQIVWDFEFDEDGYTEGEREHLESWLEEGETLKPRTDEEMMDYAKSELLEVLWNSVKYNDLYTYVDVVPVE